MLPAIPTPQQLGAETGVTSQKLIPLAGGASSVQSPSPQPVEMQKAYWTFQDLPNVKPADVLVVLAHPDDELLLSGTIEQLAQSGKSVQMVYATDGSMGQDVSGRNQSDDVLGETRSQETAQASKALNITRKPIILDFLDGKTDAFPDALKAQLRAVLLQTQPGMVLMYNPQDGLTGHKDHKNVARYLQEELDALGSGQTPRDAQDRVKIANLLKNDSVYEAILPQSANAPFRQFFPLSDQSWKDVQFQPDDKTNLRVALPPDVQARKTASMQQHVSQYRQSDIQNMHGFYAAYPYESFTRYQIRTNQPASTFTPSMYALKNQA
jgi:LmbE family N-acetylglucosaminyl deacetylase